MPPRLVESAEHFVVAQDHQGAASCGRDASPDPEDNIDGRVAGLSSPNQLVAKTQEQTIQGKQVRGGCASELGCGQSRLAAESLPNPDMEPDPAVEGGDRRLHGNLTEIDLDNIVLQVVSRQPGDRLQELFEVAALEDVRVWLRGTGEVLASAGEDDDPCLRAGRSNEWNRLLARHDRHVEVDDQRGWPMRFSQPNSVDAREADTHDLEPRIQPESERDEIDDIWLVVHHDDLDPRPSHS